ncbi:MAG: phospholipase D-like domain-containing protein, partial [Myxococcota bacterium]
MKPTVPFSSLTVSFSLALALVLALAAPVRADRARLLVTSQEAAEARVEMVLAARREVLASSFIFGDDPFTMASMALLRDAARRGLEVEVLVDAQWNKMPSAVLAHLLDEKIEIREFHPFRFDRLGWIFRRMHDKLLVTDGGAVIAGGRNVESTYFGLGRQIERNNYIDLDMQVEGEAAREARAYFLRTWASRHVRPIRARATDAEKRAAAEELDEHKLWLDQRIDDATNDAGRPPRELS